MHFRDRGQSIQLVRTTYDGKTKKPATEVLGRLRRPTFAVSDETKARLRPDELAEVEEFRSRIARKEAIEREYEAGRFAETLERVTAWLSIADADSANAFVEDIQKPLSQLRRQMMKRVGGA